MTGPGSDLLPPPPGSVPPETHRAPGPRTRSQRQRRRAHRRKQGLSVAAAIVAGLAALFGLASVLRSSGLIPSLGKGRRSGPSQPSQQTWLLFGTLESDTSGEAAWISVASWDPKTKRAFMMYVPKSTLVEIPGYGQDVLSRALSLGHEPLLLSTTANLLGIGFAHQLKISDQSTQALFDKAGGIDIDVAHPLAQADSGGRSRTLFASGRQHMDGARVAAYLDFIDSTGDEVARGARNDAVWAALWAQLHSPDAAGGLFSGSRDLFGTDASAPDLAHFFSSIASAAPDGVQYETMPVKSSGIQTGSQFYAPDRDAIAVIVDRFLAGSRPHGSGSPGRRVEILNGNGQPGIGQQVSDRLIPQGFEVVLNQNAKRFDYPTTQIVVYSDSRQALATADEVRRLIGVGEVVISRQQQAIVDVTVVVGSDFLGLKR